MTLKGIMERSFSTFNDDNIAYFKNKILEINFEQNNQIRKITSILINTFITLYGVEQWLEILNLLMENLSDSEKFDAAIETLQIILEDSGNSIEEKNLNVKLLLNFFILFRT